jgi:tripartite-type tricarboxylate transporter receptor subunit TctC
MKTASCFAVRVLAAVVVAVPLVAGAQTYPSKPIRIIVPAAPGSTMDSLPRMFSAGISADLGQPIVVENRPGANNVIGSDFVARSVPDGHTLLITTPGSHQMAYFLVKDLPYDPRKDFTPITAVGDPITCIAVNPSVPASDMGQFIAWLRKNLGKVAYGSPGIGSAFHLMGELLKLSTGVQVIHVPYKGVAPAVQDTVAGQVQFVFSAVNNVIPHMKSGKLKVLAVLAPRAIPQMPGVPPIGETLPGFERPASWYGFLGPGGLPSAITHRFANEVIKQIDAPGMRAKLESMGLLVIADTPEEFTDMYMKGFDLYGKVIKASGMHLN